MCSCNDHRPNNQPWHRAGGTVVTRTQWVLRIAAATLTVIGPIAGLLAYHLTPTDLERAESDLKKGWMVVRDLEEEARDEEKAGHRYSANAREYRRDAEESTAATDPVCVEWYEASAQACRQLAKAKWERRNTLIHLTAQYRRLIAEAECEILRAKDARDRGTPYQVAPRVRDLLAPILNTR